VSDSKESAAEEDLEEAKKMWAQMNQPQAMLLQMPQPQVLMQHGFSERRAADKARKLSRELADTLAKDHLVAPLDAGATPLWVEVAHPEASTAQTALGSGDTTAVIQGQVARGTWKDAPDPTKVVEAAKTTAQTMETCVAFAIHPKFGVVFFNEKALDASAAPHKINFAKILSSICKHEGCNPDTDYLDNQQWSMYAKASVVHQRQSTSQDPTHEATGAEGVSAALPAGITNQDLAGAASEARRGVQQLSKQARYAAQRASQISKDAQLLKQESRKTQRKAETLMDKATPATLKGHK